MRKTDQPTIAAQLRAARIAAELSQEQAAARLGVVLATWSRWERGITEPSFEQLARVAKLLGCEFRIG